jgi:hypothetical protein
MTRFRAAGLVTVVYNISGQPALSPDPPGRIGCVSVA